MVPYFLQFKIPTKWKMFQRKCHSSIILKTTHHKTTWSLASGSLEDWKDCRPCTHPNPYQQPCTPILISNPVPLLNYKTPHNLLHSRLGHTVFEGTSLQCPPLSDKAIKLFVSTSPRTLPPRFDSALVYRGQVFGIDNDTDGRLVWWRQNETQKQRLIYFTFKISIL